MSEKKNSRGVIIRSIGFALAVGLVALVVCLLTYKQETHTTTDIKEGDYGALECNSSEPEEPFFVSQGVQRFTHEIKIMFAGDRVKEMSYRYDGTYNSDETAEHAMAIMHKDYNKYMESYALNSESLNPVFSENKSKITVSLYAESKKVDTAVARLFFIQGEDFDKLNDYKPEDYKKMYESKGFTCKMHD